MTAHQYHKKHSMLCPAFHRSTLRVQLQALDLAYEASSLIGLALLTFCASREVGHLVSLHPSVWNPILSDTHIYQPQQDVGFFILQRAQTCITSRVLCHGLRPYRSLKPLHHPTFSCANYVRLIPRSVHRQTCPTSSQGSIWHPCQLYGDPSIGKQYPTLIC